MRGAGGKKNILKIYWKENIPLGGGCAGSSAREFRVPRPHSPRALRPLPREPPTPARPRPCVWSPCTSAPGPFYPGHLAVSAARVAGLVRTPAAPVLPGRDPAASPTEHDPGRVRVSPGPRARLPRHAFWAAASNATCGALSPGGCNLNQEWDLFLLRNQLPECGERSDWGPARHLKISHKLWWKGRLVLLAFSLRFESSVATFQRRARLVAGGLFGERAACACGELSLNPIAQPLRQWFWGRHSCAQPRLWFSHPPAGIAPEAPTTAWRWSGAGRWM